MHKLPVSHSIISSQSSPDLLGECQYPIILHKPHSSGCCNQRQEDKILYIQDCRYLFNYGSILWMPIIWFYHIMIIFFSSEFIFYIHYIHVYNSSSISKASDWVRYISKAFDWVRYISNASDWVRYIIKLLTEWDTSVKLLTEWDTS